METLLISAGDVREYVGNIKHVTDDYLTNHIRNAQLFEIKPILGTSLYDDLISRRTNKTLTGDTLMLVNDYIRPALSYYAWSKALYDVHYKVTNKGLQSQTDPNAEAASEKAVSMRSIVANDTATGYANVLRQYLIDDDGTLFPLFRVDHTTPRKRSGSPIYTNYYKQNCDRTT